MTEVTYPLEPMPRLLRLFLGSIASGNDTGEKS